MFSICTGVSETSAARYGGRQVWPDGDAQSESALQPTPVAEQVAPSASALAAARQLSPAGQSASRTQGTSVPEHRRGDGIAARPRFWAAPPSCDRCTTLS